MRPRRQGEQRFVLGGMECDQSPQPEKGQSGDQRSKRQNAEEPRLAFMAMFIVPVMVADIVVVIEIVVSHP